MFFRILLPGLLILLPFFNNHARESEQQSIGPRFHHETSYGESGLKGDNITWGNNIPLYKSYENSPGIKLPSPVDSDMNLETSIRKRKSVRSFSDRGFTLEQLARILLTADGLTQKRSGFHRRSAPSGGALYPLEIYVVVQNVESLKPGLYHFQVRDSSLELMREGDFGNEIHEAANHQDAVGDSPVTLVITSRFDRITQKYADRGYRYAYIEAGAVCQNVYLQATALKMGTVAVGAFNDDATNKLIEVDGVHEAALLIMPIGFPVGE